MAASGSGATQVSLPAADQILLTREIAAPASRVYRAWTTPELVRRWWAGRRGQMSMVEIDLRPGGSWYYVMAANAGFELGFRGEYREIVPGEKIVASEIFETMPGAEALDTVTFTETDGRTTLRLLIQARGRAERDAMLSSGLEAGLREQLDALDEVATALT